MPSFEKRLHDGFEQLDDDYDGDDTVFDEDYEDYAVADR